MISTTTANKIISGKELTGPEAKEVEEHMAALDVDAYMARASHDQEIFDRERAREEAREPLKVIIVGLVTFILAALLGAFTRYGDSITKEVLEEALTIFIGAVLFAFLLVIGYATRKEKN
jgi:hypothetical protein